jgi:hypothetical protein
MCKEKCQNLCTFQKHLKKMNKFELNKEKYQQDKVVVSRLINQAEVDLVGGIWTDKDGKIHYVGLTVTDKGLIVPDFPQMKDVYIADVAQVGLRR